MSVSGIHSCCKAATATAAPVWFRPSGFAVIQGLLPQAGLQLINVSVRSIKFSAACTGLPQGGRAPAACDKLKQGAS